MELLEKCQNLYEELKALHDGFAFLEDKIKKEDDVLALQQRYVEEFQLAIALLGCYEDLMAALEKLEKEPEMEFNAKRMRKNAEDLMTMEELNVRDDL